MPLELCNDCKKMHYTTNPCAQMIAKRSTAARMDVRVPEPSVPMSRKANAALPGSTPGAGIANDVATSAGTQALPVDTTIPKPKRGRPRLHDDRRAYKTAKQREYRSKLALNRGET